MLGIHHNGIQTVRLFQTKFWCNPVISFGVDHHTLCNLLFEYCVAAEYNVPVKSLKH